MMTEYRCPKCKEDYVLVEATVEIDVNEQEIVSDVGDFIDDLIACETQAQCGDCGHNFELSEGIIDDDDDEEKEKGS